MPVTTCAHCGGNRGELFDPQGNALCAACDAKLRDRAADQHIQMTVATQSVERTLTDAADGASPRVLYVIGTIVTGIALAFGGAEWFLVGQIHYVIFFVMLMAGLGCFFYAMSVPAPFKKKG